jgi:hypothetical protein
MEVVELADSTNQLRLDQRLSGISFKLDLLKAAIYELDFLKEVDYHQFLYDEHFVHAAVIRYEKLWLPFLADISKNVDTDTKYCPPLDIHWVWHVHMLSPVAYQADCQAIVGRLIGHVLRPPEILHGIRDITRRIWKEKFPDEPFDVILSPGGGVAGAQPTTNSSDFANGLVSKISYNIEAAAARQKVFCYQVSLPHYADVSFHEDSVRRYKMYLSLKKKHHKTFLVPCYDIDLIWHAHQVHPQDYISDCNSILGFVLKHDDSVNQRHEGSKLNNADEVTRRLWFDEFSVPFARPGSMFRGNPPQGKLFPITGDYQRGLLAPREMEITLLGIDLKALPPMEEENLVLSVQLETEEGNNGKMKKKKTEVFTSLCPLRGEEQPEGSLSVCSAAGLGSTTTITHTTCPKLGLRVLKPNKKSSMAAWFGCNPRQESLAASEEPIDLFQLPRASTNQSLTVQHRMEVSAKTVSQVVNAEISLQLENERLGPATEQVFHIQEGSFYNCVMPENVESLWGPIHLGRLAPGVENTCRAVTHG